MIDYEQIRDVHLEISTLCNASCPWCPRNFWGYPYNGGYPELYLTLQQTKKIFAKDFLQQLTSIRVNGNYGDIVMNPQGADIIEFFAHSNASMAITINTNGGARNRQFWRRLARTGAKVKFALDGLSDTHHLYRQNIIWETVIRNAGVFIESGGNAIWQMIRFKHNLHQIEDCKKMSRDLGFSQFELIDEGRDTAPVFDRNGKLLHLLGNYNGETSLPILLHKKQTDEVLLEDIISDRLPKNSIACEAKRMGSIYIAANGDVSPCCWMGFFPKTYGRGQYHQAANAQISGMIKKNNALQHPLKECIDWFEQVQTAWQHQSYEQGRLVICDDNCGS